MTTLSRCCWVPSILLGLALTACGASKQGAQPPVEARPSEAAPQQKPDKGPASESDAVAAGAPLTLLADPPAPKAMPAEAVSERGWLGVALGPHKNGVVVDRVVPGSPAEKYGLSAGVVIQTVAGEQVREPRDVVRIVAEHAAGDRLPIVFREAGRERLVAVELAGRPVDRDITRMSYVGRPAPEFGMLNTVKGSVTPTLQALRGKVVVLEFWASWCAVCRFMVPMMNEWQTRFGPEGAVVLGVTVDSVTVASNTANQLGMDYPLASDADGTATRAYSANALPTLFIIDQKGTVREVIIGYSEAELGAAETLIANLLSGS